MSTHPTILGDMLQQQAQQDDDKTSLDVERDLGIPTDAGADRDDAATARAGLLDPERPPGARGQRIESE